MVHNLIEQHHISTNQLDKAPQKYDPNLFP